MAAPNSTNVLPTQDIEMAQNVLHPTPLAAKEEDVDPHLIVFTRNDPRNPLNWPTSRKWAVTDILSATGFNRIMVSTIMAPALPLIAKELDMTVNDVKESMKNSGKLTPI